MSAILVDDTVSVGTLRRAIAARLHDAGIESAELDARVLLAHALGIEASKLIAASDERIPAASLERIDRLVGRRLAREPVARIVGYREFWSRDFALGPDTLVPRPESETVVEAALAAFPDRHAELRVLDLGVGSGVLLAAVLLERPRATGVGVDRNAGALAVARANLADLGLSARGTLLCGDWTAPVGAKFDLVVANPPYIPTAGLAQLTLEVCEHDPIFALDGGPDGLAAYRAIVADLSRVLTPHGVAVLELGQGQEAAVVALANARGLVAGGAAKRDLSGLSRALVLRNRG
ncbi:MAG TPA: peptide chain release factor N(5)-glutamine methyltransferase [Xanthobacteraceae bacterium]|nr:peptide chain release factor N(5)-glutamine methyltransferase [Xanthobacteraceae bacterium]